MEHTDVAIIGAGPIGLELAVALKRASIDYLHFDKHQIGQMIYWFPPQTRFFSSCDRISIAGIPLQTQDQSKATREEYLAYLRTVVGAFDLDVRTYEPLVDVEPLPEGGFRFKTRPPGGERDYRADRLVLATGGTARPKPLGIPGEDLDHVSHYFRDPHIYFRKRVLVVGGRNSAVEAAIRCYHVGAKVAVSYRGGHFDKDRVKYWLLPEINGRIERGEIEGYFNTRPRSIRHTHVTLAPVEGGDPFEVEADFVLLMVGYEADMSLFRKAGVELEEPGEKPRFDEKTMETNVPGLYVAGTAVAGTQETYKVFIENCHIHVDRIVAAITGAPPPEEGEKAILPES